MSMRTPTGRGTPRTWLPAGLTVLVAGATLFAACAPPLPPVPTRTQIGTFTPFVANGTVSTNAQVEQEARRLGVDLLRVGDADLSAPNPRDQKLAADGFRLVLTGRNHPALNDKGDVVTAPIADDAQEASYRGELDAYLAQVRPELFMVENEELDANFFGGSALQYLRELNAAVDVAHAHGVRVTDGGITTVALSLLTWGDLHDRGLDAQADDFATRAFARPDQAWLRADLLRKPFTGLGRAAVQAKWDQGKVLVQGLKVTGVDVVDLHWYGNDPSVLRQAIDYLKAATAKPVISTEMGQYDQRPDVVQSFLSVVTQERLPYVIWFDADGDPAVALHDPDGTLRPNGDAFAAFVQDWRQAG